MDKGMSASSGDSHDLESPGMNEGMEQDTSFPNWLVSYDVSKNKVMQIRSYRSKLLKAYRQWPLFPGGGGTSTYTYTGRAVFQGIIFQHKFLNRVWKLIRNSETGYDYLFKNNRLLFSLLFWNFCNVIIPKQGTEMHIFFLNGLWRFLKNGHLPVKLHSSVPPPASFTALLNFMSFRSEVFEIKASEAWRVSCLLYGKMVGRT